MITLASGLAYTDLQFENLPRVIAAAVVQGPGGVALIDPGPSSTLPVLRAALERAGIAIADLTAVLLTHVHLDHAGASGTIARENPRVRFYVHEKGAPHLVDPSKLMASASRLYAPAMDRLWGDVLPVPAGVITSLAGGERIEAAGRPFEVAYTPGHASHHVSYFSRDSGIAFVGDTVGIKVGGYVLPPTPPPDIDIPLWGESLARIGRWAPDTLFVTHFGPSSPAPPHLTELRENLESMSRLAKGLLDRDGTDEERERWFMEECRRKLRRRISEADANAYEVAGRLDLNWKGLARYWSKQGSRQS